jgi:hypothetical protein
MRKELLSLTFLALLLIPALSLLPSAQTGGYDWAISAYSSNLDGYSSYEVNFQSFSYFNLNNTGFYSIAEMFNLPLNATGTFTINGYTYNFNEVLVQMALLDLEGTFYLDVNFILMGPYGPLLTVVPPESISYNPQNSFIITTYSSGNTWYGIFSTEGQTRSFPDFPIYPGDVINNAYAGRYLVTIQFNTVPNIAEPFYDNGYIIYPDVAFEVHAPSQTSFVDANPYFVTLFKLYVNNKLYNAPWNGQNLISADSASGSDDNGAMIGANASPSNMAWGADEYVYNYTYYKSLNNVYVKYQYDVSYWLLGTQNGIKAFAGLNGLPINDPKNGNFVNLITLPQEAIAVPSYIYSPNSPIYPLTFPYGL